MKFPCIFFLSVQGGHRDRATLPPGFSARAWYIIAYIPPENKYDIASLNSRDHIRIVFIPVDAEVIPVNTSETI